MTAVVTGSAGFIGSALMRLLPDAEGIDWKTGRSVQTTRPHTHPSVIYHLASPVGPLGVMSWAGSLVPEVIGAAEAVADWAINADCPLVFVSTSEVYGSGDVDREDGPCHFGPGTSARKEYAVAKLAAETMLRNTPGLDVRIVRPFNVAGPGQLSSGGFVIPRFIEQASLGLPMTVYIPGTQRRAFGHVEDIARGIIAAGEVGRPGEVYNLGNPENTTNMVELATLVRSIVNPSAGVELLDPRTLHGDAFAEAPDKLPNIDKALAELDWRPRHDLERIVRDAWHQS